MTRKPLKCIVFCYVVSSSLSHGCAACFDAPIKMSRQPTLSKFGLTKGIIALDTEVHKADKQKRPCVVGTKKENKQLSKTGYDLSMFLKIWLISV